MINLHQPNSLQVPRVCSFQSTNYTIIVAEGTSAGEIVTMVTKGPFNGTVSSDDLMVTEGLDWGKTYQVSVIFFSQVLSDALEVLKDICKFLYTYSVLEYVSVAV